MADIIWGDVKNIVDGDTFDIRVTHYHEKNKLSYNNSERIRIADTDAPEIADRYGLLAKQQLERALYGKHVRCEIQSRDVYGRLVCKVSFASGS